MSKLNDNIKNIIKSTYIKATGGRYDIICRISKDVALYSIVKYTSYRVYRTAIVVYISLQLAHLCTYHV